MHLSSMVSALCVLCVVFPCGPHYFEEIPMTLYRAAGDVSRGPYPPVLPDFQTVINGQVFGLAGSDGFIQAIGLATLPHTNVRPDGGWGALHMARGCNYCQRQIHVTHYIRN